MPLLQMSPLWITGVTARPCDAAVGAGTCSAAAVAPVSCVKATVQLVLASPGSRCVRLLPRAPPWEWYQTTSRVPFRPAAIHGKMSALPVSPPAALSGFTW